MSKTYTLKTFLYSTLPIILLLFLNLIGRTLVGSHTTTGFLEDFPALWLTGVGIIFNVKILTSYLSVLKENDLNIFKNKFLQLGAFILVFLLSLLINHQWVVSQLNNNELTWTTIGGSIAYVFSDTSELFNFTGLVYYISCVYFWGLLLSLTFLFITSFFKIVYMSVTKHSESHVSSNYIFFSGLVITSYLFYYISLQINDIVIEGFHTFSLHANRQIMLFLALVFLIIYMILIAFKQNKIDQLPDLKENKMIFLEIIILMSPFTIVTFVTMRLKDILSYDSYIMYSVYSFVFLLAVIIIIGLNFHSKHKRILMTNKLIRRQDELNRYVKSVEELYNEMRLFRHDHHNLKIALNGCLAEGDYERAKKLLDTDSLDTSMLHQYHMINKLAIIKNTSLKSILFNKLLVCEEKAITVSLDLFSYSFSFEDQDIVRIIGNLMDNAIEACESTEDKRIHITIDKDLIEISNTYLHGMELGQIKKIGYSSKGDNRGYGLSSLTSIFKKYDDYDIDTSINADFFVQRITAH
ncbi:GHKL domain-containing protein [Acidaminobacter sp. JC074]|uniref:sensor histidine kinase n=1 Tax=Acidaminobacter sp. JC074 TaxID=2530199 RepID=UPI001F0E3BEF|nr:GHKL domain-containing protein [Acidaminobacter sp. JC074]MCH4887389.1 GHKL domain-containing protein [Acidaminobacter sp. JC074]